MTKRESIRKYFGPENHVMLFPILPSLPRLRMQWHNHEMELRMYMVEGIRGRGHVIMLQLCRPRRPV